MIVKTIVVNDLLFSRRRRRRRSILDLTPPPNEIVTAPTSTQGVLSILVLGFILR